MRRKADPNIGTSDIMRIITSDGYNYDDHLLSPEEKVSILQESVDGLRWIAYKSSKLIDDPQTDQKKRVMAS